MGGGVRERLRRLGGDFVKRKRVFWVEWFCLVFYVFREIMILDGRFLGVIVCYRLFRGFVVGFYRRVFDLVSWNL